MAVKANKKIVSKLIEYMDNSPSSFHAVSNLSKMLDGFTELKENEAWSVKKGGSYYVIRKDSSIIAFRIPKKEYKDIRIVASHSDSPTFKVKPNPEMPTEGHYVRLNTEKYGGMIMYSWLDRPLSVAGRVIIDKDNKRITKLINVDKDMLIIPSVAIHMNREVNDGMKFNAQIDTIPLYGDETSAETFMDEIAKEASCDKNDIIASDLFLYLRNKSTVWGRNNEYISGRALDDLQCAFTSMVSFVEAVSNSDTLSMCCIFDNEEVGSLTAQGADSTFLSDVIERINASLGYNKEVLMRAIANGYMISSDNAHAVHPNHPEYSDPTNKPFINNGIVIKYNAAQKYTTDAHSEAMFRTVCKKAKVPVQTFANKSNMAGGSTLGNLSNRHLSIKTVDIGLPQLSMHSAYETAGTKDTQYLYDAIKTFYEEKSL